MHFDYALTYRAGGWGFNEQNKLRSKEPEAWKHGTD